MTLCYGKKPEGTVRRWRKQRSNMLLFMFHPQFSSSIYTWVELIKLIKIEISTGSGYVAKMMVEHFYVAN